MEQNTNITLEAEKVIAFRVEIAKLLGSNDAALMLQQILHWTKYSKNRDGWVYKSAEDMFEETNISERKQRKAREILVEKGWIEAEKKMANGSPTWHYRALVTINTKVLTSPTGNMPNATGKNAGSITKNTHKNIYVVDFSKSYSEFSDIHKIYSIWLIEMVIGRTKWSAMEQTSRVSLLESTAKQTKLTPKRYQKMSVRLEELGFEACRNAIIAIGKSDWHKGDNDRGWKASLEWLFNSTERTEEWSNKK